MNSIFVKSHLNVVHSHEMKTTHNRFFSMSTVSVLIIQYMVQVRENPHAHWLPPLDRPIARCSLQRAKIRQQNTIIILLHQRKQWENQYLYSLKKTYKDRQDKKTCVITGETKSWLGMPKLLHFLEQVRKWNSLVISVIEINFRDFRDHVMVKTCIARTSWERCKSCLQLILWRKSS